MVQTLARRDDLHALVRAYGHVVIDECHHVPAVQVERVLAAIPARYITGLTATRTGVTVINRSSRCSAALSAKRSVTPRFGQRTLWSVG